MQLRIRALALAALLSLTAAPALAQQFPTTMGPNTVYCRLAIDAGPGSACPISVVLARAGFQAATANLTALLALSGTGFPTRTDVNTWAQRTITGTANEITVTNGAGIAANPILSLPTAMTFTGKTVTGGTFNATAFNGPLGGTTPAAVAATTGAYSGNVVIGSVPLAAWRTDRRVTQINTTALVGFPSTASTVLSSNSYVDSSDVSRYIISGIALYQLMNTGGVTWGYAASGTAGDAISFATIASISIGGVPTFAGIAGSGSGCVTANNSGTFTGITACSSGGLPVGGTIGQMLFKYSAVNGEALWANPGEFNIAANPATDCTGATNSDTPFSDAFTNNNTVLIPPGCVIRLSSNYTIAATKWLVINYGGRINPDNTKTLTIRGRVRAGAYWIFGGTVGGVVTGIRDVTPDWWGCYVNGANDDSYCLNAADASVLEGSRNGSAGSISRITLSAGTYFTSSDVIFHPENGNPLQVVGAGQSNTCIKGSSSGTFTRGIVTIAGAATGGADTMDFTFRDFCIYSANAAQNVQCLTIGTSGKHIQSYGKNKIENLFLSNCLTLIGIYEARLLAFHRMALWSPNNSGAIAVLVDPGANGSDSAEGIDFWGGQIVCGSTSATGVRLKSTVAGNGVSAIRFHGFTWYSCNRGLDLLSDGGPIGDIWVQSGSQCDSCSTVLYANAAQANAKSIVNLNFDGLYTTANSSNNALFEFHAATRTDHDAIADVSIRNGRYRGSSGRFIYTSGGILMLNVNNNQLTGFYHASLGNELILLNAISYATITSNTIIPDGIPSTVNCFINTTGGGDDVVAVGNNGRGAVATNYCNHTTHYIDVGNTP